MREIKYRALDAASKEWMYGYYVVLDGGFEMVECIWQLGAERATPIDCSTLGQYTGLVDFNGREIYEGDIVLDSKTKEVLGYIGFIQQECAYKLITKDWEMRIGHRGLDGYKLEVIGNIYQNEELWSDG